MLFAGSDAVDAGDDATGSDGNTPSTGDDGADCRMNREAACKALWNTTDAAEVTSERTVVPYFDDDRLDKICR